MSAQSSLILILHTTLYSLPGLLLRYAHSQTLPNKSSALPPNPPCFGPDVDATGLAWDHPPNSSSCCTLKPPALVDVLAGLAGSGSPQPESNPLDMLVTAGAGVDLNEDDDVCVAGGAGLVGSGSGVAHASLEPHASALLIERLAIGDCAGLGAGAGAGAGVGCDRLNAE